MAATYKRAPDASNRVKRKTAEAAFLVATPKRRVRYS